MQVVEHLLTTIWLLKEIAAILPADDASQGASARSSALVSDAPRLRRTQIYDLTQVTCKVVRG
jgi:hypothetical protein